jgi:hypothetical protein
MKTSKTPEEDGLQMELINFPINGIKTPEILQST